MTQSKFEIADTMKILTVPGLNGSGPDHWQTRWEHKFGFTRIEQDNWENPNYFQWVKSPYQSVEAVGEDTGIVLVAHSLGCLLVVKAFPSIKNMVKGVLLVAPPDLDSGIIKKDLSSFSMPAIGKIDVPGFLIYSENDPYASVAYSESFGKNLGIELVNVGERGHINSDSHIGDWEEGMTFLSQFLHQIHAAKPAYI